MDQLRFLQCLPFVLREEVVWHDPFVWSDVRHNFSNDRHDSGGATMCGIIQREYDHWRKHQGLPVRPVELISESEGHAIYYESYWLPHCSLLPPGLDLSFFDAAVNEGSTEAIKILQHVTGCAVDGQWGPKTAAAVSDILPTTAAATIQAFTARREEVYREMKDFRYFGKDWEARSARIGAASLEMAHGGLRNAGGATGASAAAERGSGAGGTG
jgi:lysozyme family protein